MLGKFITFEGGEGVGKSTQIGLLAAYLQAKGIPFVCTREPGGSGLSEEIRTLLLDKAEYNCTEDCEALLIAAARIQHVHDVILPSLQAGKIVLCDRYVHSTFAYQGYGRGMDMAFLKAINAPAMRLAMPDMTFFLHLQPQKAFGRKGENALLDRIEQAGLDFHNKVYTGYRELARQEQTIVELDASLSVEEIHKKILQKLQLQ